MSENAINETARSCAAIAEQYERHAARYPAGSLGREGNLAEAAKYHGMAGKFAAIPALNQLPCGNLPEKSRDER